MAAKVTITPTEIDKATEQALVDRWIEASPHKRGRDEVQLVGYAIPVWALVGYLGAVKGDVDQVAHDYDVPRAAVDAALAYYRCHTLLIDARIEANTIP